MAERCDIAIIGSGPGGYVAAIRAAQLGFKTVCIEKNSTFGGTCLNVGCIPSKTLLQGTEMLYHLQHQGKEFGLAFSDLKVDFTQLMSKKKQVVKTLVDGVAGLLKKNKVDVIEGLAEFVSPNTVKVTGKDKKTVEVEASYFIIATGSEPISLKDIPIDERQVVTSTGILSLPKVPSTLVVVGAGVIGVELASVYNRLGSKVMILEMLDHICPALDADLSRQLQKELQKQGIEFHLSSQAITAVVQPEEVILMANLGGVLKNISTNVLLVAVGRRPFTSGLQLEKAGVEKNKKGYITVDGNLRTTQPHIFAIGDVIDGVMLAHRASAEGVAVVEYLKGNRPEVDYLAIPNVIYTYPEVAVVGLSEQEAKEAGIDVMVGKSYFRGNARARCTGETEGFVKVVGDRKSGKLVGAHILGPHASELIAEAMLALQKKAKVEDLADAPQAHPTFSEAIKEAALDALGRPLHQ